MNHKEIKELIELLVEKDIAEFELERGDMKLHIKRGTTAAPPQVVQVERAVAVPAATYPLPAASPVPAAQTTVPSGPASPAPVVAPPVAGEPPEEPDLFIQKSPIVGTFYESPSPGAPPFVKLGDVVKEGQILCIVEAMKLMNEIEAEVSGEIVKQFVSNGNPVEYGMPLFGIRKH